MTFGSSWKVVALTIAAARFAGSPDLKMPEPTKTPSQPSCIISAASAGVAIPPAAKLTTGNLPISLTAYRQLRDSGYYRENPGADVSIEQLLRGGGQTTENTRGIRLGGLVEIRNIIQEEMERAFQGGQTADQALVNAQTRGNQVLRNFERTNRGN